MGGGRTWALAGLPRHRRRIRTRTGAAATGGIIRGGVRPSLVLSSRGKAPGLRLDGGAGGTCIPPTNRASFPPSATRLRTGSRERVAGANGTDEAEVPPVIQP